MAKKPLCGRNITVRSLSEAAIFLFVCLFVLSSYICIPDLWQKQRANNIMERFPLPQDFASLFHPKWFMGIDPLQRKCRAEAETQKFHLVLSLVGATSLLHDCDKGLKWLHTTTTTLVNAFQTTYKMFVSFLTKQNAIRWDALRIFVFTRSQN